MNQIYEHLFSTFSEKAQIKQDAHQIIQTLKTAYPNSHLPVDKTIKRVLNGQTAHPRDTLLGFWAAFVLNKTEIEVLEADRKNRTRQNQSYLATLDCCFGTRVLYFHVKKNT